MKLATLRNGARDGRLVVVSRDITRAADASAIAPTLQHALDDWPRAAPRLEALAAQLEIGAVPAGRFHEHDALSPLPRAFQWLDGSAYLNHVELVRKARGAPMPASFWSDPLMYQGGSDSFLAPRDPIRVADESFGVDFEGEVAVIVDDVPLGASREVAAAAIALVMLANDVSLRNLIPSELAKGFGFLQSKPSSAFSPVAVTPVELGRAWDGKLHLPLRIDLNGAPFGFPNAGVDMTFDFPALIAHAARTRALTAGTIIGSRRRFEQRSGRRPRPRNRRWRIGLLVHRRNPRGGDHSHGRGANAISALRRHRQNGDARRGRRLHFRRHRERIEPFAGPDRSTGTKGGARV